MLKDLTISLNYLKIFKAVPKNNPRTHSPQENVNLVIKFLVGEEEEGE